MSCRNDFASQGASSFDTESVNFPHVQGTVLRVSIIMSIVLWGLYWGTII